MTAVFVDTSFYVAIINRRDSNHAIAIRVMTRMRQRMVTTEHVLVELGNWLCSTANRPKFMIALGHIRSNPQTSIISASPELLELGLEVYRRHGDKEWSLTDCISFALMRERGIAEALTADHHFQQAGFRALLLEQP